MVLLQPFFLIMKGVAILVFIITIGRIFELMLYTIFKKRDKKRCRIQKLISLFIADLQAKKY